MNIKKYSVFLIISLILISGIAMATDFIPQGDINLLGWYSLKNAIDVNSTNIYQNGSLVLDVTDKYLGGLSCGDEQIAKYNSTSGNWECEVDVTGTGVQLWADAGTYLIPNTSYAANVWIKSGYLNVTEWLKVYGDTDIFGNLTVHGDINSTGSIHSSDLTTGEGTFGGNIDAQEGINLNKTINDSNSNSYIIFNNGEIEIHLED